MSKTTGWLTVSLAAVITSLSLSALAQQSDRPPSRPQPNRAAPAAPQARSAPVQGGQQYRGPVGPSGGQQFRAPVVQGQQYRGPVQGAQQYRGPVGPVQGAQQYRGAPQGQQFRGPAGAGQYRAARAVVGQPGYSFRSGFQGRRMVGTFSDRERVAWHGGRWYHGQRFGRYGYWWGVNGAWYFYDQPYDGPPDYVSEVEFSDEGPDPYAGPYGPAVVDEPVPAGPPVVYGPPVYAYPPPPPVVCVGPLCVR